MIEAIMEIRNFEAKKSLFGDTGIGLLSDEVKPQTVPSIRISISNPKGAESDSKQASKTEKKLRE